MNGLKGMWPRSPCTTPWSFKVHPHVWVLAFCARGAMPLGTWFHRLSCFCRVPWSLLCLTLRHLLGPQSSWPARARTSTHLPAWCHHQLLRNRTWFTSEGIHLSWRLGVGWEILNFIRSPNNTMEIQVGRVGTWLRWGDRVSGSYIGLIFCSPKGIICQQNEES